MYLRERENLQGGEQEAKEGSVGGVGPGEEGKIERRKLSFSIMFTWNCKDSLQGLRNNIDRSYGENVHFLQMPISRVFALILFSSFSSFSINWSWMSSFMNDLISIITYLFILSTTG